MGITAAAMFFLILESKRTVEFAAMGLEMCIRTVIPSLFPFFVLSIWLTGNLSGGNGLLPILLSGFLGGYPVGAQAAAESFQAGRIPRETAEYLLTFCSQAGPAFLFGMVAAQFPERKFIWMLWIIQILSALSVAAFSGYPPRVDATHQPGPSVPLARAMKQALGAMASVCGWVVSFRVILGFLSLIPLNPAWRALLWGFLELTNGCMCLGAVESLPTRFLLAGIILNFGGICVALQTASVIDKLSLEHYLRGKVMQTAFAFLYCHAFTGNWTALIPIPVIFLLNSRYTNAKNSSIPSRIGV